MACRMADAASVVQPYLDGLGALADEGRRLAGLIRADPGATGPMAEARHWQRACESMVARLSGGSKAHWLARAFSEAFLVPVAAGSSATAAGVPERVPVDRIVERIVVVLERAAASLSQPGAAPGSELRPTEPRAPRYQVVADPTLRSQLEDADAEGERAFDEGAFGLALVCWSSVIEALITYALERATDTPVADWPFAERIAAAERARLVSGACARLPATARTYRDLLDADGELRPGVGISDRDARTVRQVLTALRHDLAQGR